MQLVRKSFGRVITLLLLLMFSVAIIPMDFYHNHAAEEIVCKEHGGNSSCQHKFHLSKKSKSCWACTVHYHKTYIKSEITQSKINLTAVTLLPANETAGCYIRLISTALRGPPNRII